MRGQLAPARRRFDETLHRFVAEVVVPNVGEHVLYQVCACGAGAAGPRRAVCVVREGDSPRPVRVDRDRAAGTVAAARARPCETQG